VTRHAAAPVGRGTGGQRELVLRCVAGQSRNPLRASPGADCGASFFNRSDDDNCHGTDVTITLGSNSSLPFSRNALWLCSTCYHQSPTTYSGMNTVTTVRGESLPTRLT